MLFELLKAYVKHDNFGNCGTETICNSSKVTKDC